MKWLVLLILSSLLVAAVEGEEHPWCLSTSCSDTECSSEQVHDLCVNGECDYMSKKCICRPCFVGDRCEQYVDSHKPKFIDEGFTIFLSDNYDYELKIIDDDECQHRGIMSCPCTDYELYFDNSDANEIFDLVADRIIVHNSSRVAFDLETMERMQNYQLTIRVKRLNDEPDSKTDDSIDIVIVGTEGNKNQDPILRSKRALDSSAPATTFTVTPTNAGRDDTVPVSVGSSYDYTVTADIPTTGGTSLTFEVTTNVDATAAAWAGIIDVVVSDIPGGASLSKAKPSPTMIPDPISDYVYSSFTLDYGEIVVTPATVSISFTFKVVITKADGTVPTDPIYVSVGVEAHGGAMIWIGADPYKIQDPASQPSTTLTCSLVEFSTIPSDVVKLVKVDCYYGYGSESVIFDALLQSADPKGIMTDATIGHLGICDYGANIFSIIGRRPRSAQSYFYRNTNNVVRAVADLGYVTNFGAAKTSQIADNQISFGFGIKVGSNATVGDQFKVSVGITIGATKLFVGEFDTTVAVAAGSTQTPTAPLQREISGVSTDTVEILGTVAYVIRVQMTTPSFYEIKITTDNVGGRIDVCAVDIVYQGVNIQFIEDPSKLLSENSGTYTVNFGLVEATNLCTRDVCSELKIELAFNIMEHASNTVGAKLTPTISLSDEVLVVDEVTLEATSTGYTPTFQINPNSVLWSNFYPDGIISGEIRLTLEGKKAAGISTVQVVSDSTANAIDVRICRVEIASSGDMIPCLRGGQDAINAKSSEHLSTNDSVGIISLGPLCATEAAVYNESDRQVTFSYVLQAEPSQTAVNAQYSTGLGLILGSQHVWAGTDDRTHSATFTSHGGGATVKYEILNDGKSVGVDGVLMVAVRITVARYSMRKYVFQPNTAGDADIGLCIAKVYYVGHNIPCLDVADINENRTTFSPDSNGNAPSISIDMGTVANVHSSSPILIENYDYMDTIGVLLGIRVIDGTGSKVVKADLDIGGITTANINFDISSAPNTAPIGYRLPFVVFEGVNGDNNAHAGAVKAISIETGINAYESYVLKLNVRAAAPHQVCSFIPWYFGDNYCNTPTNSTSVASNEAEIILPLANGGLMTTANASVIGVLAIVRPDVTATVSVNLQLIATVAGIQQLPVDLPLTIQTGTVSESQAGPIVVTNKLSDLVAGIRETVTSTISIKIPSVSTVNLQVNATCPVTNNIALCVVLAIRVVSAGKNIACFNVTEISLTTSATLTSTISNSQNNSAVFDVGSVYASDTTQIMNMWKEEDNEMLFEVDIQLTDHLSNTANAVFSYTFTAATATSTESVNPNLKADRSQASSVNFVLTVTSDFSTTLNDGDTLKISLKAQHANVSRWEAKVAIFCVYLPLYLEFQSQVSNMPVTEMHHICLKVDNFLFNDIFETEITTKFVKSKLVNVGTGLASFNVTIPYAVHGTVNHQGNSNIVLLNRMAHITVVATGQQCGQPLLDTLPDCYITSPTALDATHEAPSLKFSSPNHYSPFVGPGDFKHYIEVDFGNRTTVSVVTIRKVTGFSHVIKYKAQYSDNGYTWLGSVVTDISGSYVGDDAMHSAPNTAGKYFRFFRFCIEEISTANTIVALKLELAGCTVSGNVLTSEMCTASVQTRLASSVPGRHFCVDTSLDTAVVCDYTRALTTSCYFSSTGNDWKEVPISSCLGKGTDGLYGKTYDGHYMYSTDGGNTWMVTDAAGHTAASVNVGSSVVSADMREAAWFDGTKKIGNWEATFDGVTKSTTLVLRWSKCCT